MDDGVRPVKRLPNYHSHRTQYPQAYLGKKSLLYKKEPTVKTAYLKSFSRSFLGIFCCALLMIQCQKIPLSTDFGRIENAVAHWFENENVVYLFFSIAERENRVADPQYILKISYREAQGGESPLEERIIDFTQGVHEHTLIPCAPNTICGSFTLLSEKPVTRASLEFRYDSSSSLGISENFSIQNHPLGDKAVNFSALSYGVFDESNEHLETRIVHQFGFPGSTEIKKYGMRRRFRMSDARLHDVSSDDLTKARQTSGSPFVFPASPCDGTSSSDPTPWLLEDESRWYQGTLDRQNPASAACFTVDFLDKKGNSLLKKTQNALALRNPVLKDQSGLTLKNPLTETIQIPIVIKICDDDPSQGSMVDREFFSYQRYVLGLADRPEDLCFRIGKSESFRTDLTNFINQKLAETISVNSKGQDYLFVVVLHEKFSTEFTEIQSIVSETLTQFAKNDSLKISPRIVGSFVYSGSTNFFPTVEQQPYVLWCPQNLMDRALAPSLGNLSQENCQITPIAQADLRFINFVAPLGPLPSLEKYREYVSRFGDAGLAKNPSLRILSVPQTNLTQIEENLRVTYFDGQRYAIGEGEKAKACANRTSPELLSLRVKPKDASTEISGIPFLSINGLWLSQEAKGEYLMGIGWNYSFWGGITYKGALNGKILSIIPYTESQRSYEDLGDPKWSQETLDVGNAIQHCFAYCSHPTFDENGEYQVQIPWDLPQEINCQSPKIPQWLKEGASQ
jgi:hypothetical protein